MLNINHRHLVITTILLALAIGTVVYVFVAKKPANAPSRNETSTQTSTTQKPSESNNPSDNTQPSSPSPSSTTYPVKVFFSKHPDSDNDPSKTFAVDRTSPDAGVGAFAISELLKGPSGTETNQGYFASARLRGGDNSVCNNRDFTLTITDSTAELRFCRQFDHIGSISDGQAESELKATLVQFSNIKKVIILNKNGDCEFNLSGQNLCKQ